MRLNEPATKSVAGLIITLLAISPLLGGCGSSNSGPFPAGSGSQSGSQSRAKGTAIFTIKWPDAPADSRVIPAASQSITVTLARTPASVQPVAPQTVPVPAAGQPRTTTVTFPNLELGDYTATATAFPTATGTGTPQAAASVTVTVVAGNNNPLTLTMNATVTSLTVTPATGPNLAVGIPTSSTRQLAATPRDAAGNIVLVAPSAINWTSSATGVATVNASGLVAAVGPGTATITAVYTEPNIPVGTQGTGATGTATVTVATAGPASTTWPQFHATPQKTGQASVAGTTSNNQRWQFTTGGSIVFSSPAIGADGTIYVGAYDNKLYAINPNGTAKAGFGTNGTFTTGGIIESSPAISLDGTVYVGSNDGNIYALNGQTGAVIWQRALGGIVHGSPTIGPNGIVYIGASTQDNAVFALDPFNGAVIWQFTTATNAAGGIQTAAALSPNNQTLYVGSLDTNLYAINVANGTLRWRFAAGDQIFSSTPAVDSNGNIYFGSFDGKLYALTPAGNPLNSNWPFDAGSPIYSSPAVAANGTVYFGTFDISGLNNNRVFAVDSTTATLKWDVPVGDGITSSPAVDSAGTVYIGSYDGNVYALEPNAGGIVWTFPVGDNIDSSPAIGPDGAVYIGGFNSRVFAIGS